MPRLAIQRSLECHHKLTIKDYLTDRRHDLVTTATTCNYGGYRHWFICECGRRVGVLYFAHGWRCRHCVGLPHQSQLNQPKDRLNERINAIRERLHWGRGVANGHGKRPKRMHHQTFERLTAEHDRLANKLIQMMI